MSGKLTKAHRDLLACIADEGDGWFADIRRVHAKHRANVEALKQLGLVAYSNADTRVRVTDAGRAALLAQPRTP